jgi:hypothetical protein
VTRRAVRASGSEPAPESDTPRADRVRARISAEDRRRNALKVHAEREYAADFRRGVLSGEKRRAEIDAAIRGHRGMVGRVYWVRSGVYEDWDTPTPADLARQDAIDTLRAGEGGQATRYRAAIVLDTRPGEALIDRGLGLGGGLGGGGGEWVPLEAIRDPLTADEVRRIVPTGPETRGGTHSAVRPGFKPFRG